MYASAYPGLSPADLVKKSAAKEQPFPLSAPRQLRYHRAKNALYHLCRSLRLGADDTVLVPDYHHGSEVSAIRASGAQVLFYPIDRRLEPYHDTLRALMRWSRPRIVLVIHYLGWPQPIEEIKALARDTDSLVVEDCALSFLSESNGRPLGTAGDWALYCLYETLPVPNGAVLVANGEGDELPAAAAVPCGLPSVAARTAELLTDWLRSQSEPMGRPFLAMKRGSGRLLRMLGVERDPAADTGFDPATVDLGMSALSTALCERFDYETIRRRRRFNFLRLRDRLAGHVTLLRDDLPEGACPLFFPILVQDKATVRQKLAARGVDAVEFWNDGDPEARREGSEAHFLRRHVLELPVHQGLDPDHVDFVAEELLRLRVPPIKTTPSMTRRPPNGSHFGAGVGVRPVRAAGGRS
jgi:dTDP-4-amino-4,6-dideoxygalactose transaminase